MVFFSFGEKVTCKRSDAINTIEIKIQPSGRDGDVGDKIGRSPNRVTFIGGLEKANRL